MRKYLWIITLLSLALVATPLEADTVFTNIVGNCCGGIGITGAGAGELFAEGFIPTADYVMTNAQIEVFSESADPLFNVSLFSNAAGKPGELIATIDTHLTAPLFGGIVVASGPTPSLTSGTEYWLVLSPFDRGSTLGWEAGGNKLVPAALANSSNNWLAVGTSNLQFQIDGSPEPEPEPGSAVLTLLGIGFVLVMQNCIGQGIRRAT